MKNYTFKLKHDKGTVNITVLAQSHEAAKAMILQAEGCPPSAIKNTYEYVRVIQQNYGHGWEDVSEYECNSQGICKEISDKPGPKGKPESLFMHDLREYRLSGYSTRAIKRRNKHEK